MDNETPAPRQTIPAGWVVLVVDLAGGYRVLSIGRRLLSATTTRRLGLLRQRVVLPLVDQMVRSGRGVDERVMLPRGRDEARVLVEPIFGPGRAVHGVAAWLGPVDAEPAERPSADGWTWHTHDRRLELGTFEMRQTGDSTDQTTFSAHEYPRTVHIDDRAVIEALWDGHTADIDRFETATVRAWRDQTLRTVRLTVQGVDNGTQLIGVTEDITEMESVSTEPTPHVVGPSDSSRFAHGLELLLDEPVAVIDTQYRQVLSWLREPRMLDDLTDGMIVDSTHPDDRRQLMDLIDAASTSAGRLAGRVRMRGRDGAWLDVDIAAAGCGHDPEGASRVMARLRFAS